MSKELYFIPIIARALKASQTEPALREAFAEIERRGRLPGYEQGYMQYCHFMQAVRQRALRDDWEALDVVQALMIELVTETFLADAKDRQAALDLIHSRPEWREEYERLSAEAKSRLDRTPLPEVQVLRGDELVATVAFSGVPDTRSVEEVYPGRYTVSLDTGRVVWEGELAARDLIWSVAFPGRPLSLAADTGDRAARPTREETLLDGQLIMRVFPGVERGRIELAVCTAGAT